MALRDNLLQVPEKLLYRQAMVRCFAFVQFKLDHQVLYPPGRVQCDALLSEGS